MAFDEETKTKIKKYALRHLGSEEWHHNFFDFIDDPKLAKRLGQEFLSIRFIYKLLEGLSAEDWLLRSQIRLQVLSYASIYEAALHHILFNNLARHPAVIDLKKFPMNKEISIPATKLGMLEKALQHGGKTIIPTYAGFGKTDESKVRFDRKAECAHNLGIIKGALKTDLMELYGARNAIHIHAEIRKNMQYEIELSVKAYRRLKPFKEQIVRWQSSYSP